MRSWLQCGGSVFLPALFGLFPQYFAPIRSSLDSFAVFFLSHFVQNTWAFVGGLDDKPQLSCVYQSEDAQNEFLSNPKLGIGEDVYDDDRAREEIRRATGKLVKGGNNVEAQQQPKKTFVEASPAI